VSLRWSFCLEFIYCRARPPTQTIQVMGEKREKGDSRPQESVAKKSVPPHGEKKIFFLTDWVLRKAAVPPRKLHKKEESYT